ncbi:MAG: VOC family protein [Clostridiales bacterium]|jgi:PhnB protein|nr:VOC family protein [Clostridiales bacterium]
MFSHYLLFNGNCAEALEAYKNAFGGQITEMQKYGDMPPNPNFPIKDEQKNYVLHAKFNWEGTELMCADSSLNSEAGSNMYVSVTLKDAAPVQKAWDILKEGGEIYMDLAPSFFASAHGSLRDKFGVNWMFTALK